MSSCYYPLLEHIDPNKHYAAFMIAQEARETGLLEQFVTDDEPIEVTTNRYRITLNRLSKDFPEPDLLIKNKQSIQFPAYLGSRWQAAAKQAVK